MLAVFLPLVAYALLLLALVSFGYRLREAFIHSAVWWGVLVAAITECLSVLLYLNKTGLAISWAVIDAVVLACVYKFRSNLRLRDRVRQQRVSTLDKTSLVLVSVVAAIIVLVGLIAVICPPNTADSMTYHMPRIVHWLHDRTVAFSPVHDLRQISLQPWSEYAMLQFHGLAGRDRFDPLIEWFSYLGCIVGASLIAELLGASYPGQVLAAVIGATIPQAVLEGSSTTNDVVVAFWLVALQYFLLKFAKEPRYVNAISVGFTLGLACLTKGTAYILAPPLFCANILFWTWRRRSEYMRYLLVSAALFLVVNLGFYVREIRLFGSPVGPIAYAPPRGWKFSNDDHSASAFASNVLRNVALQLSVPNEAFRKGVEDSVRQVVGSFADVSDPRTTWDGTAFAVPEFKRHETVASNPVHLLLIITTLIILGLHPRAAPLRPSLVIASSLILCFALFCYELKWQPWHTRLHLPLFLLWAGVSGMVLASSWPKTATNVLSAALVLLSLPYVFGNDLRPLAWPGKTSIFRETREVMYFNDNPSLLEADPEIARFVQTLGCGNIGLNGPGNDTEYDLLMVLNDLDGAKEIRHVDVDNVSKVYGRDYAEGTPCMVICMDCWFRIDLIQLYARRFPSVRFFGGTAVFSNSEDIHSRVAYRPTDFDRNGVPDLVVENDTRSMVAVRYVGGSGQLELQSTSDLKSKRDWSGWRVVAVADLNGDGFPDLVWQEEKSRHLVIEYYGGARGTENLGHIEAQPKETAGWRVVGSADFDRDGIPDLIWQNDTTGQAAVWYMGGKGGATRRTWGWLHQNNVPEWHVAAAADFNRDREPDVVWENTRTGDVEIHYQAGPGGQMDAGFVTLKDAKAGDWHVVMAADFNGDFVPDLVWQNRVTGQLKINYHAGSDGAVSFGWAWLSEAGIPGWTVVSH